MSIGCDSSVRSHLTFATVISNVVGPFRLLLLFLFLHLCFFFWLWTTQSVSFLPLHTHHLSLFGTGTTFKYLVVRLFVLVLMLLLLLLLARTLRVIYEYCALTWWLSPSSHLSLSSFLKFFSGAYMSSLYLSGATAMIRRPSFPPLSSKKRCWFEWKMKVFLWSRSIVLRPEFAVNLPAPHTHKIDWKYHFCVSSISRKFKIGMQNVQTTCCCCCRRQSLAFISFVKKAKWKEEGKNLGLNLGF